MKRPKTPSNILNDCDIFFLNPKTHPHLINFLTSRHPSHWVASKAVYLICFLLELSLSTLTHLLLLPNPSISLCFSLLPLHTPSFCDNIDYCSAGASTCWISNRTLWQKPRAMVSTLRSPWILTNPAAVLSILHPLSPPKLCRFLWTRTEGRCVGCHSLGSY